MLKTTRAEFDALTPVGQALARPEVPESLTAANERLRDTAEARWPFEPQRLLEAAREATGLDDFGDDYFREALDQLCASIQNELDLSPVGRRNLHGQILDHLVQRLRFVDLWKRQPEILDEPIEAPIIIVGLPRSGTTFLQQLLAADERLRPIPFWENLAPLPAHDPAIRPPEDAPLIAQAEANVEGLRRTAPGLLALHQLGAEDPEEEIYLLGPAFATTVYEWVYMVPGFASWFAKADHRAGYRFFRQVLQTLQWMRGGRRRFLLKAPQHMEQLVPLLEAFPDAVVVETVRDPLTAASSLANLCCYGQRLRTERPDPLAAGVASEAIVSRLVQSYIRDRDLPFVDARFVTVPFADLMREPVALAERVLTAARLDLTDETRAEMQRYLDANEGKERAPVDYGPADFGIDIPRLRDRFQGYYARFGLSPDPKFAA